MDLSGVCVRLWPRRVPWHLLPDWGATAIGYFVQGWFKFGGFEFFKIKAVETMGEEAAWNNKTAIYLGASAAAETIADIFLCPLEAVRIRAVSDPEFSDGLVDGFGKMLKADGIGGFYAGLIPILCKQVPYTMAKFAVQGTACRCHVCRHGQNTQ